jgi:hypothetical protein
MKILFVFFLLLSLAANAVTPEFQLNGKFIVKGTRDTPIEFVLTWSEDEGRVVNGRYSDDFFTQGAIVTGSANHLGRNFLVRFPANIQGVRTISIIAPQKQPDDSTIIPVTIVSKDGIGTPLSTSNVSAEITMPQRTEQPVAPVQAEEEAVEECIVGFGVLAGFCGIYRGALAEEIDPMKQCNLQDNDDIRLELDLARNLKIYFRDEDSEKPHFSFHIGKVPHNPENRSIEVRRQLCGAVPDTRFPEYSCKTLNLSGTFSAGVTELNFIGTLSVFDETTLNMCKYSIYMGRKT